MERTLLIIKPDANKSIGTFIPLTSQVFNSGLAPVADRILTMTSKMAAEFYREHAGKPFFIGLVEFMSSRPCHAIVLEGVDAVRRLREMAGATDPKKAGPDTLRRLYGTDLPRNAVHASDSVEAAQREISFFFAGYELI